MLVAGAVPCTRSPRSSPYAALCVLPCVAPVRMPWAHAALCVLLYAPLYVAPCAPLYVLLYAPLCVLPCVLPYARVCVGAGSVSIPHPR